MQASTVKSPFGAREYTTGTVFVFCLTSAGQVSKYKFIPKSPLLAGSPDSVSNMLPCAFLQLQEHSARALCNMLASNECVRQKALEDGFLDKLQVFPRVVSSPRLVITIRSFYRVRHSSCRSSFKYL